MSAVKKTDYLPDAATMDLWRIAENGDVKALESVLPRVPDINARNEHGVTALMRAAQYGHVKMVRALLEHGADANIKRNDKFTALALAAFFGHTEIVRVLMEHGADSRASTRYDTSPHMWATARTFNEVVNQLERPKPVEKPVPCKPPEPPPAPVSAPVAAAPRPAPVSANPVVRAVVKTAVVRTLKDPPEIWDLVHEEPRGFNARSAFLTRLKALKTGLAFRLAAIAVLMGTGVVGVMVLSGVQARNEGTAVAPAKPPSGPVNVQKTDLNQAQASTPQIEAAGPPAVVSTPSFVAPEVNSVRAGESAGSKRATTSRSSRRASPRVEGTAPEAAANAAVQPVAAPTIQAKPPEAQQKVKVSTPLSPQVIAPAKNAAPKGKVIQWP
jgi:hypothetical protein